MHIIERAYQLARSGKCVNLGDIRNRLKSERFDPGAIRDHFTGKIIRGELTRLCKEATGDNGAFARIM
jgi:hypothetical protein